MDFFNKLGKKASETYKVTTEKTGKLAQEVKLKLKMNENKSQITELYEKIGEKVYQKHVLNQGINIKEDLEEECTKIDVLSQEIDTHLNECLELKDKKQCKECFFEIEKEAIFCSNCGAKQDEETVKEAEIVEECIHEENNQNESE